MLQHVPIGGIASKEMTGMTRPHESRDYCAFVLRCWAEHPRFEPSPPIQRFSLEDIHTGQRYGFSSVEALMAFVQNAIDGESNVSRTGDK
jgi:hypothetical protein